MVIKKTPRKKPIRGIFSGESIVSSSQEAKDLYGNSQFGEYVNKKVHYSLSEALYLVEKKKMEVFRNTKKLNFQDLMEKCKKLDKKIFVKYNAYKDLRSKGYLLKTALKFGADFRVYDKGKRPGKSHARWILFVVSESDDLTWHEFSAKNRVAHSTKKNLLIAVVDSEGSISYYEVSWKRP
jgi:tRNA-intron endonuclease, archaea type